MYKIFTKLVLIVFSGIYCAEANTIQILENFYQKIDIIESKSYQVLLQNLSTKLGGDQSISKTSSVSQRTLVTHSDTLNQEEIIRRALNLDKLISHFESSPPKVEIVEEEENQGVMIQRLKISDSLVGVFEARIVFPSSSIHKHSMILGIHGHGDNCSSFVSQNVSSKLLENGFGIFTISFRAMRRIYESSISRELVKLGHHLMGIRLYETYIGWQILRSHPLVDSNKICVLAHSGGSVVANLFVRVFPNFKALVYDYTSSFHRDWDKLCCESLPKLNPYQKNLQSTKFSPIPALKVTYGFTKDLNTILKFFSDAVLGSASSKSVESSTDTTHSISLEDDCSNHYASLQDKCYLRKQIEDYILQTTNSDSSTYSKLRIPRSKVQYLLEKLILKKDSSEDEIKSNFLEVIRIIKRMKKPEVRDSLINRANESICKLGVEYCDLWMMSLAKDPSTSYLVENFDNKIYWSAVTSGSVKASVLISHLPRIESKVHSLLNLLHGTANPNFVQLLQNKLNNLLREDSNQALRECVNELIEKAEFKSSCWKFSVGSDYVNRTGSLPKYLKNLSKIDDQKLSDAMNHLHDEPDELLTGLLGNITTNKLSKDIEATLAIQIENLYSESLKLGNHEEFIKELIPYLKLFNLQTRMFWVSRALLSPSIDSSIYETKAYRLEIMQEALEVMSHSELAKIISNHNDLFDDSLLEQMIYQALEIDRLDHADVLLSWLSETSQLSKESKVIQDLKKELSSTKLELRIQFQTLLQKISAGEEFGELEFWYEERSNRRSSVQNLIKPELAQNLLKKFPNYDLNESSLRSWFCFYKLFNELNYEKVYEWLRMSLINNLSLADTEDSKKIKLAINLLKDGELKLFETVLSRVTESQHESEVRLYRELFLLRPAIRDLQKSIPLIKTLDSFSRSRFIRILFDSISRSEFLHNYSALIELSELAENVGSSKLIFEWIRCAIRMEFFTDAVMELDKFHSEQKKNEFKDYRWLEELSELWLRLGYAHKAREITLINLRRSCSNFNCYHEITNLVLNAIDFDQALNELHIVKRFFKQLNDWLSKHDSYRENFCLDVGFEEYCDKNGYFSNL